MKYRDFLTRLAVKAGEIQLASYGTNVEIEKKSAFNLVSKIDKSIEQICFEEVRKNYPESCIIGEEGNNFTCESDYTWIFDPLDGTHNYLHNLPYFSFGGALLYKKQPIAAVVFDPLRKELFYAEKGEGAFLNGEKIRSSAKEFSESLICFSDFKKQSELLLVYKELASKSLGVRSTGSSLIEIAYVASGRYGGKVKFGTEPWDFIPGMLLVTEAGGVVIETSGASPVFESRDLVFSGNESVQKELISILKTKLGL